MKNVLKSLLIAVLRIVWHIFWGDLWDERSLWVFLSKNLHLISMLFRCYIWEWIKMSFVIFLFLSPHVFSPQHWVCASSRRCYWVTVEQRGEPLHLYKKTLLMRGNGKKRGKEAVSEWENMARVLMREKGRERWRENQEMGCRESKPSIGMSR